MRRQAAFLLFCALFTAGCPLDLAGREAANHGLPGPGPFATTASCLPGTHADQATVSEVVGEVRIHGNHATPDAEVVALAGVRIGSPLEAGGVDAIRARLAATGRFARVEVRKRFRSLVDPGDIAIIVVVEEHPISPAGEPLLNPLERMVRRLQFLPMLSYEEGYGFTYGARVSLADPIGRRSRLTVPLSWGGTRQAAAIVEKSFGRRRASRVEMGAEITQQEHPFYEVSDRRGSAWARVSQTIASTLTIGARAARTDVSFGEIDDDATSVGVDASMDLRQDPLFPRNTAFVSAGWEWLDPASSASLQRRHVDARGYLGLVGQSVVAVRGLYDGWDGSAPPWRQVLLGGGPTLRGHPVGAFVGDKMLATSAELRLPLNSPLKIARAGVDLFYDAGKIQRNGLPLGDARWEQGAGVGVFLLAPFFQVNLDVASDLSGGIRWHFAAGARF